jgi:hypothetical protein
MKTKKEYDKEYYQKNKKKKKDAATKWAIDNRETRKEYLKQYKKDNAEALKIKNKEYRESNSEKIKKYFDDNKKGLSAKKSLYRSNPDVRKRDNKLKNEYTKERNKIDPLFKLKNNLRSTIGDTIRKTGFKKNTKTQLILGCTFIEFKEYIEKQFEPWMNWNNYGRYNKKEQTWQLDHKIPVSSAKTEEKIIKLNHYANFQPLESLQNIIKSNKIL